MTKNPRIVTHTAAMKTASAKAWLITRIQDGQSVSDNFTGNDMFVQFWCGEGVLDAYAFFLERSDWVDNVAGEYVQHTGVPLAVYADYFKGTRRFKVEEITAEEAAKFRASVEEKKRELDRAQAALIKAKHRAKSAGREGQPDERIAAETARVQAIQNAMAGVPTPTPATDGTVPAAAPAAEVKPAQTEKLPHEQEGGLTAVTEKPATGGGGTGGAA